MSDHIQTETPINFPGVTEIGEASPQQVAMLMQLHRSLPVLKERVADLEISKSNTLVQLSRANAGIQEIINEIKETLNIPDEVKWDVRSDGKVVAFNIEPPSVEAGDEE